MHIGGGGVSQAFPGQGSGSRWRSMRSTRPTPLALPWLIAFARGEVFSPFPAFPLFASP
jgi:hypothetical protein